MNPLGQLVSPAIYRLLDATEIEQTMVFGLGFRA